MRLLLQISFLLIVFNGSSCGFYYDEDETFYNLFLQTNISQKAYYPFLKYESSTFYSDQWGYVEKEEKYRGNIELWNDVLKNWTENEIDSVLYGTGEFDWSKKKTKLDLRAKGYILFSKSIEEVFTKQRRSYSWDYNDINHTSTIDYEGLLIKANEKFFAEKNEQLKFRYGYQIIRLLHYSKDWEGAIKFYQLNIEKSIEKNELHYYILDQVAGCYYSLGEYEKAAYMFTKVFNNSLDRKKSSFLSFVFCTKKNFDGQSLMNGVEDEKDLLLLKSLRDFSDEIESINKFILLDANDERVELLFIRALNNLERKALKKEWGQERSDLKSYKSNNELLKIAENQTRNSEVDNVDFWRLVSSYLSYLKKDLALAKRKLEVVESFEKQTNALRVIYEIEGWDKITPEKENFLDDYIFLDDLKMFFYYSGSHSDFEHFIMNKIAHLYYKNGEIAKAFLVHNSLDYINDIHSISLLNDLEKLYFKQNKTNFEKMLIEYKFKEMEFIDFVYFQKGIYYLYENKLELATKYFEKNKSYQPSRLIQGSIFSNNIKECYRCETSSVMEDLVYLAKEFSFIQTEFSRLELTKHLSQLEQMTKSQDLSQVKLSNYLLGNYYFNISNTGYFRGLISDHSNTGDYIYISYVNQPYKHIDKEEAASSIIDSQKGYNLLGIKRGEFENHYYSFSKRAEKYYDKVISVSSDKELNARCQYLIAKCELNTFYNEGGAIGYSIPLWHNRYIELPFSDGFKALKAEYRDTKFHAVILKECSYYNYYYSLK